MRALADSGEFGDNRASVAMAFSLLRAGVMAAPSSPSITATFPTPSATAAVCAAG